jgi:glycine cleavage system regulatory protein
LADRALRTVPNGAEVKVKIFVTEAHLWNKSMPTSLVLTIVGPDRPGLVNLISDRATAHDANWLESRMANLAGQFTGIVLLQVPDAKVDAFASSLAELEHRGLHVLVSRGEILAPIATRRLNLELMGHDRPGIVREISGVLAHYGVSIDEFVTDCVSGSMSGGTLFRARARLLVPAGADIHALRRALEDLANELIVDVTLDESGGDSSKR